MLRASDRCVDFQSGNPRMRWHDLCGVTSGAVGAGSLDTAATAASISAYMYARAPCHRNLKPKPSSGTLPLFFNSGELGSAAFGLNGDELLQCIYNACTVCYVLCFVPIAIFRLIIIIVIIIIIIE